MIPICLGPTRSAKATSMAQDNLFALAQFFITFWGYFLVAPFW